MSSGGSLGVYLMGVKSPMDESEKGEFRCCMMEGGRGYSRKWEKNINMGPRTLMFVLIRRFK